MMTGLNLADMTYDDVKKLKEAHKPPVELPHVKAARLAKQHMGKLYKLAEGQNAARNHIQAAISTIEHVLENWE
jgi:hypothetical protein